MIQVFASYIARQFAMCPSYLRIRLPLSAALARFDAWISLPQLAPARNVCASKAVEEACDATGNWRGIALFVHESDGWTVFDDLTGYLASVPAVRWAELAAGDELIFAGYNDSVPYGQLIVIRNGSVVREFLEDLQDPGQNVNNGRLDIEQNLPIDNWIAAASFVDEDDLADAGAANGLLWLFQRTT
jgi:hypothetical protein